MLSLLLLLGTKSAHANTNRTECGIYLAPSSIPGAGFGMFAGKNFEEDAFLDRSLAIPFPVPFHYSKETGAVAQEPPILSGEGEGLLGDYTWFPLSPEAEYESHATHMVVLNAGSLANFHPYHENIELYEMKYDDTMFDRFTDVGAGAVTYYTAAFRTIAEVVAGEELFLAGDEEWAHNRIKQMGSIYPSKKQYILLEKLVRTIHGYVNGNQTHFVSGHLDNMHLDIFGYILNHIQRNSLSKEDIISFVRYVLHQVDGVVENIFPISYDELENMQKNSITSIQMPNRIRNLTWLEENGICMDHIEMKTSTISQAGRGAFAKRRIKNGSVVGPLPLIAIADNGKNLEEVPSAQGSASLQLFTNYCFKNESLSFYLCALTNLILMNHKSSKGRCERVGENCPNAYLRWGSWDQSNDVLLGSLSDFMHTSLHQRLLSLEVVATKNIDVNEEIFIDYGSLWDEKWSEHENNWHAPNGTFASYERTSILNDNTEPLRAFYDLTSKPYESNVNPVCYYWDDQIIDGFPNNYAQRGYEFYKFIGDSKWAIGKVTSVTYDPLKGYLLHCVYDNGEKQTLTMEEMNAIYTRASDEMPKLSKQKYEHVDNFGGIGYEFIYYFQIADNGEGDWYKGVVVDIIGDNNPMIKNRRVQYADGDVYYVSLNELKIFHEKAQERTINNFIKPDASLGSVGYKFRKYFDGMGWYNGVVTHVLNSSADKKSHYCVYEDGYREFLSKGELLTLKEKGAEEESTNNELLIKAIDKSFKIPRQKYRLSGGKHPFLDMLGDYLTIDEVNNWAIQGSFFVEGFEDQGQTAGYYECRIIDADDSALVTVEILQRWHLDDIVDSYPGWMTDEEQRVFVKGYRRESILFVNKPFSSDLYLPSVFRHHIGLNNELFPIHWQRQI